MSNPPVSDRALRGALSLPGVNAEASRAIRVKAWLGSIGTVRRLRQIALEAPWSVYDLLSSLIVFGIGVYLLCSPTMFYAVGGVYQSFAGVASERVWGVLFTACGFVGCANTLWCVRPGFGLRLISRMAVAFCLLSFALNNLLYDPPPLSTVTYFFLSAWAIWGILRTRSSGR